MIEGGDKRTSRAKVDIAKREQQIVQLRLRRIPFAAIARTVGVSKSVAVRGFYRALRRNTDQDIQTHHRSELAELDAEASAAWELTDTKDNPKTRAAGLAALNRIHIRRAKLLGLDAPTKLDISGIYQRGGDDSSVERLSWEAILEALPVEEQVRWHEVFQEARRRAEAGDLSQPAIETTVSNGSEHRNGATDEPDDGADITNKTRRGRSPALSTLPGLRAAQSLG
jgi:hypothetical protein